MKKVDVTPVLAALEVIREFNALNLDDVELWHGEQPITFTPASREAWKLTGLANRDLFSMRFTSFVAYRDR
jgi:hypothetical protein